MGCNSTRGFGDLEDDKKYADNESRPDDDTNGNTNNKNYKENKNDNNDNKMAKMPIIKMLTISIKIMAIKMTTKIQIKMIKIMVLKVITRIPKMVTKIVVIKM